MPRRRHAPNLSASSSRSYEPAAADVHGLDVLPPLSGLRATFGIHIAALAMEYGIHVEKEIASIFSAAVDAGEDLWAWEILIMKYGFGQTNGLQYHG
jgi:hypothetical protein